MDVDPFRDEAETGIAPILNGNHRKPEVASAPDSISPGRIGGGGINRPFLGAERDSAWGACDEDLGGDLHGNVWYPGSIGRAANRDQQERLLGSSAKSVGKKTREKTYLFSGSKPR